MLARRKRFVAAACGPRPVEQMADWIVPRVYEYLGSCKAQKRICVFEGLLAPLALAMAFLERGCKKGYTTINGLLKLSKFQGNNTPLLTLVSPAL
jgi:hypothetical protein